jgi:hypothetical protein
MEYLEIEEILSKILDREEHDLERPTENDWVVLREKFRCDFSKEFIYFVELMSSWIFPGEIYNVSSGKTNGNDSVLDVYQHEMSHGNWDKNMIPFYGIGNGDYFCLNASEGKESKVYYYYEDKDKYEIEYNNFGEWIKDLPDFLE